MDNKSRIYLAILVVGMVLLYSPKLFGQDQDNADTINHRKNFPKKVEKVGSMPKRENFWIFFMAGQSNMAGRGFVEPGDTLPHPRILTLGHDGHWTLAKEPLHRGEPRLTGLDCGLAFGRELLKHLSDSIHIALIPCAVGGSSLAQWLGDSLHRGVYLWSNFKAKADIAAQYGEIKGVLWHQGEKDAKLGLVLPYGPGLIKLIDRFRAYLQDQLLPIIVGELGANLLDEQDQANRKAINSIVEEVAENDKNLIMVKTQDLTTHDHFHFDSQSLRIMGKRYAQAFLSLHPK